MILHSRLPWAFACVVLSLVSCESDAGRDVRGREEHEAQLNHEALEDLREAQLNHEALEDLREAQLNHAALEDLREEIGREAQINHEALGDPRTVRKREEREARLNLEALEDLREAQLNHEALEDLRAIKGRKLREAQLNHEALENLREAQLNHEALEELHAVRGREEREAQLNHEALEDLRAVREREESENPLSYLGQLYKELEDSQTRPPLDGLLPSYESIIDPPLADLQFHKKLPNCASEFNITKLIELVELDKKARRCPCGQQILKEKQANIYQNKTSPRLESKNQEEKRPAPIEAGLKPQKMPQPNTKPEPKPNLPQKINGTMRNESRNQAPQKSNQNQGKTQSASFKSNQVKNFSQSKLVSKNQNLASKTVQNNPKLRSGIKDRGVASSYNMPAKTVGIKKQITGSKAQPFETHSKVMPWLPLNQI